MKKKLLIAVICIIVLAGIYTVITKTKTNKDFTIDYPSVSKTNVYKTTSINDIISILKHGTGIVYLGFPQCPWCQKYAIYLNEVAINNDVKTINYYDIYNDRDKNTKDYQTIVSILSDYLPYGDDGKKRVYVPCVVFVNNGEIVGFNNDTSTLSGDPEKYYTEEKINYLKLKLKENINSVYNEKCDNCN